MLELNMLTSHNETFHLPLDIMVGADNLADAVDSVCEYIQDHEDEIFRNITAKDFADVSTEDVEAAMKKTNSRKFKIVEKEFVKRTYEVEADTPDEALDRMYGGELEPVQEDSDCNEVEIYDEHGNLCTETDEED